MKIKEMKGNLFDFCNDKDYYFAQSISLNCAMGKGIAVHFCNKEPELRSTLQKTIIDNNIKVPFTILYSNNMNIFNLITKNVYNGKPTYSTMYNCIVQMKKMCMKYNVKHLVTYRLGCERDRLNWDEVKQMLIDEFNDLDIEIIVCY